MLHCIMRFLEPRALFCAVWAALAGLLLHRLVHDALLLQRPSCDTTYIYEGYEQVEMAGRGRYRLIKFVDGDRDSLAGRSGLQNGADGRSTRMRLPGSDQGVLPGADSRTAPRYFAPWTPPPAPCSACKVAAPARCSTLGATRALCPRTPRQPPTNAVCGS